MVGWGLELFGGNKTPSAWRPTHRWLFTVENVADANEATEICCRILYAIAAIQAVVIVSYSLTGSALLTYLFDPVLMLLLAWFIHHKKSRTAATLLGSGIVYVFLLTLGNKIEIQIVPGGMGGKNIILSIFSLFGIYKGLQGTFRYHQLSGSKINSKNIWIMLGLLLLYNVFIIGIFMAIALYVKLQHQELWGYGDEAVSRHALGGAVILCILFASACTAFRILPWTKNKPLVAGTSSSSGSTEPS